MSRSLAFGGLLLAAFALASLAAPLPARAEEAPVGIPSYRAGAVFGGGLGGFGLSGFEDGDGGFSGYARIGYWLTDRFSLAFHWHGFVGPRPGPASFSLLTWGGRIDVHLSELALEHDLYLIVIPGTTQVALSPERHQHYEVSLTGGVGVRLKRFGYLHTSFEVMTLAVLTGHDKFAAVGGFLAAWFRTDTGIVGTADTY